MLYSALFFIAKKLYISYRMNDNIPVRQIIINVIGKRIHIIILRNNF